MFVCAVGNEAMTMKLCGNITMVLQLWKEFVHVKHISSVLVYKGYTKGANADKK